MKQSELPFWNLEPDALFARLGTSEAGLTSAEAGRRLREGASHVRKQRPAERAVRELAAQFKSPIILILVLAAGISAFLHETTDTAIILSIVLLSGLLGFWQEHHATSAVEKLLALVKVTATVLRNGGETDVPVEAVAPGDVVLLNAGDVIPGDGLLLESKDLFVDEAALTGETYPVEKMPGASAAATPLAQRRGALFMGTHVISGSARAVIALTGARTEFGRVSARLKLRPATTDFERGVRRFGYFLMELTLMLVIAIFAINVHFHRPVLDSFLFALALAVGLTPQLLPAVISVNLAHGARAMAARKVIVKRLAAIENFGSMNVLCSDKTGTLTQGSVTLHSAVGVDGQASEQVLRHAVLNAMHETGFTNPIDEAIRQVPAPDVADFRKVDEVPYDFVRKRVSILVARGGEHLLITKGALSGVLQVCSHAELDGTLRDLGACRASILERFEEYGRAGHRVLGVACRNLEARSTITRGDETGMTFLGFLLLHDPPKAGVAEAIDRLRQLGVSLKIITGDSALVARSVSRQIGLPEPRLLCGPELDKLSDEALRQQAGGVDIFAEVEPNEKERIILALRKAGNVVGYMGDGINDASALHAADVSLSVDDAVDVAKEAADIVLLEKDLSVLVAGVEEGRRTFANTLKYVFMATSANFGNMFSMAGASLFLPFLPLLPKQILLTNILTDLPEMAIPTDHVNREMIESPRRWDMPFIRRFMFTFGLVSSIFDYLTFAVLLFVLHAGPEEFRTGWFVESVVSASLIVLVVRTRRPFFKSRASSPLLGATLAVMLAALLLPYAPFAPAFGFVPLPASFLAALVVITACYVAAAELAKRVFYRAVG
jgi:Mg2+-importing ATPase